MNLVQHPCSSFVPLLCVVFVLFLTEPEFEITFQ